MFVLKKFIYFYKNDPKIPLIVPNFVGSWDYFGIFAPNFIGIWDYFGTFVPIKMGFGYWGFIGIYAPVPTHIPIFIGSNDCPPLTFNHKCNNIS